MRRERGQVCRVGIFGGVLVRYGAYLEKKLFRMDFFCEVACMGNSPVRS